MASTTCIHLPWRGLVRTTANAAFTRTSRIEHPSAANPFLRYSCRNASNASMPLPAIPETTSKPQELQMAPPIQEPDARLPRSVQAIYLKPLRREAKYGVPSCDLQMRSYNVRNLEFFADFALRAAYYLNLPAYGPVPLPRITERWTVPRDNFIYKKSQENFERKTLRRLIQIKDGHPQTVGIWLAFLKKHAYYGIGMKANIWEYSEIGVGKSMDVSLDSMKGLIAPQWANFGLKKDSATAEKVVELMNSEIFRAASGGSAPMMGSSP